MSPARSGVWYTPGLRAGGGFEANVDWRRGKLAGAGRSARLDERLREIR